MNARPLQVTAAAAATAAAALLLVTSCSSGSPGPTGTSGQGGSGPAASGGRVAVVASTDVWGDIAATVGGDAVSVTSIITSPDQDPHSYEASTRTQLALSKARVVLENGGGYDDFVGRMLAGAGSRATVLDAVEISGKHAPAGEDLNEHVWYDVPTVAAVADRVAATLAEADPAGATTFTANASALKDQLAALEQTEAGIAARARGTGVAITEPVPGYLLEACGLRNLTPAKFSQAVEEDTDVAPAVLKATEDLFTTHAVKALVYNEQTTGAQTRAVLQAAEASSVAVVPVTETLPRGQHYVSWMTTNLERVQAAVAP